MIMKRQCEVCSTGYLAKRRNSRYCGGRCQKRAQRGGLSAPRKVRVLRPPPDEPSALVLVVERELSEAGRLNSALGQQALLLAGRISAGTYDTGSAIASMSRELTAVMARALDGAHRGDDPLDELKRRRIRQSPWGLTPRGFCLAVQIGALVPDGQHRANQRCEGSHDCENDREV
jgi:hypothetical protein